MKKTTILKSLVVAAGLLVGTSAWAQVSSWTATAGTYTGGQEIKGDNEGVLVMTLGNDAGWTYDTNRSALVTKTQQSPTLTDGIPTQGGYVVINPVRTLNLSMTTYSSQSNCNLYMYEGTTKLKDFRQKAYCTNDFGRLEAGKTYYIYGGGFKAAGNGSNLEYVFYQKFTAKTYENYTIHFVDNHGTTIKEDVTYSDLYGSSVTASEDDMASIEFGGNTYGYKSGNETITLGTGTNEITLVYETAEVCNYTIKYVNDSDPAVEIRTAASIESYVGAEVIASGDYLPDFITYDDVKYKYSSGNATLTITGNAETDVITLVYTPAAVYTYTLNATDGTNVIKQLATGNFVEGDDNPVVYFPKAFTLDGTLYETAETTFKKVFTGSETASVVYGVSSCDYIYDEDELNKTRSYAASYQKDFMSKGYGSRIYAKSTVYTPALAGGIYTIVVNGAIYNGNPTLAYGIRINGVDTQLGETEAWGNGSYAAQKTLTNIAIPDGASFCFMKPDDGNSNVILDYVKLTKTGDYTETKTISTAGYATYYSANALDFTNVEGLTAYVATVSGSKVSFTKVEKVPAKTGVLLKGAAGEYQIPVVADGGEATSALVGVLENTQVAAGIYVLMNGTEGVGFYKTTTAFTVGANTAYLPAQTTGVRSFIGFDGESSTGISAVESSVLSTEVYDLQGRRVAQPTKGLYIMNGKKTVVR